MLSELDADPKMWSAWDKAIEIKKAEAEWKTKTIH